MVVAAMARRHHHTHLPSRSPAWVGGFWYRLTVRSTAARPHQRMRHSVAGGDQLGRLLRHANQLCTKARRVSLFIVGAPQ